MSTAPQAAPQTIPNTRIYADRVFSYLRTGWVSVDGVAASAPSVVQGLTGVAVRQGKIVLTFSLSLGGNTIPARLEIGPTVIALIVDPALRLQLTYKMPYWDLLVSLLGGKTTPVAGTPYAITIPTATAPSMTMQGVGESQKISVVFPAPYPKVGSGMLWAYIRGIIFDSDGATLDVYRPVLGFDLAKNPRFLWS